MIFLIFDFFLNEDEISLVDETLFGGMNITETF